MSFQLMKEIISIKNLSTLVSYILPKNYDLQHCSKAILIIPGNPGIIGFYDNFIKSLYEKCGEKWPVFAVQHAGHGSLPHYPNHFLLNTPLNLKEQIDHKIAFIKNHFPAGCRFILVGHSIGAYMVLQIMHQLECDRILKGILLFPTIERMSSSPQGRIATPVCNYFAWPMVAFALLLSILPESVLRYFITLFRDFDEDCQNAVCELFTANGVRSLLYMAADEMVHVNETPIKLIENQIDKLIFYYGATDLWTPANYIEEMKERFPCAKIHVCSKNIKHAFVLESHEVVADLVSTWVLEKKIH